MYDIDHYVDAEERAKEERIANETWLRNIRTEFEKEHEGCIDEFGGIW